MYGSGDVLIDVSFEPFVRYGLLPRLGLQMRLVPGLERMTWFGRGPQESYIDRLAGASVGRYAGTVDEQYVPYVMPQENGNKTDVRWAALSSDGGAESPSGLDAAEAVLRALQARLSLASSRSLDYIGKLVDSTEARMRAAGLLGSDDESAPGTDDDERFQTQLAAALSLSEMEAYDLRLRDDDSDGKGPASPEAPRSVCSED